MSGPIGTFLAGAGFTLIALVGLFIVRGKLNVKQKYALLERRRQK